MAKLQPSRPSPYLGGGGGRPDGNCPLAAQPVPSLSGPPSVFFHAFGNGVGTPVCRDWVDIPRLLLCVCGAGVAICHAR